MYSKQEENLILYQKSKHKITIHLILYFFILCVYFFAMAYLFSSMEFLKVDDPAFRSMLIKLGIGQILLYGITFILLSTGKKWFRILYWIDIAISFLIIYFPIRNYCGGWHASRDWVCTIISTIVLVIAILWSRYYIGLPHIVKTALTILQGVCVIGDIWLAPVAATNKPLTEKERRTYKLIAVILIIVYSLLSWKVKYTRGIVIFSLFIVFLAMSIQRLLDVGTKKVNKNKKGE